MSNTGRPILNKVSQCQKALAKPIYPDRHVGRRRHLSDPINLAIYHDFERKRRVPNACFS